jgi:hypothetical protein
MDFTEVPARSRAINCKLFHTFHSWVEQSALMMSPEASAGLLRQSFPAGRQIT